MTILNHIHRILREGTVVQFPRKDQQSFKPGDVVFHPDHKGIPHVVHKIIKGRYGDVAHIYPLGKDIKKVNVYDDPTGLKDFLRVDPKKLKIASR